MPTLHLICGLPCAGKTTLARNLEHQHNALRLTPDEWHIPLYGSDLDDLRHNARHDLVEALLWNIAERVLILGVNVILDFGFWSRVEREMYRERARNLGASSELHVLNPPRAVLFERLAQRNIAQQTDVFVIPPDMLATWIDMFEVPAVDEYVRRD